MAKADDGKDLPPNESGSPHIVIRDPEGRIIHLVEPWAMTSKTHYYPENEISHPEGDALEPDDTAS